MWMEFAFQELWGQKANINTMMLISKIWHIICLFWQFSFVSRMLIGNSFWHILHYPFYKVTINDFCGNFYGWHRWSRPWPYLQIKYGYPTCGRHLYQSYRITTLADAEIVLISNSVLFVIIMYSIKLDR